MAGAALLAVQGALHYTLVSFELVDDALVRALFHTVFWVIVLELIALVPLVAWISLRLSHRVAGPLVRIHAALAQMAQGQFDIHLSLRKGDALVDLADAINRLAESLRRRTG
jgi:nitrate/nitrite-specific signal transduction histidine kinase